RGQVLGHLADCEDCRDVLSLSMPEIQPARAPAPERPNWLSWPVLRWGALAACIVVVSAAVTLHYERREPMRSVAENVPAAPADLRLEGEVSRQPAQQQAANIAVPSPVRSERDLGAAGKLAKQREKGAATRMMSAQTEVSEANGPAPDQNKKVQELTNNRLAEIDAIRSADKAAGPVPAAAPSPSAAKTATIEGQVKGRNDALDYFPKASSETVTVESAATPKREASARTAEPKAKDEFRTKESQEEVQAVGGAAAAALADRKADTFSAGTAQAAPTEHAGRMRAVNNSPRWTLSAAGALERSFDSGKTWQTIPVASNVVFRALAANDSDIWLGGAAGALYHSSDSGQHWTRITPVAAGKSLTADIVTVEFGDVQHGKVVTVNRETWTTNDAGETWQYQ
ncbi:MAG: YCF48-related protein, partial [Terriglobales bacterium]